MRRCPAPRHRPPSSESTTASTRNWARMCRGGATAARMPISRVRSPTLTSMMFMIPMPPPAAKRPPRWRAARRCVRAVGLLCAISERLRTEKSVVGALDHACRSRRRSGCPAGPRRGVGRHGGDEQRPVDVAGERTLDAGLEVEAGPARCRRSPGPWATGPPRQHAHHRKGTLRMRTTSPPDRPARRAGWRCLPSTTPRPALVVGGSSTRPGASSCGW